MLEVPCLIINFNKELKDLLTIIIPNRNRNFTTIKRTLLSIVQQSHDGIHIVIVDYGSPENYQKELQKLLITIGDVELILCPTQGQLWNKSRAINIALKKCTTTFFMVSDMDMLFHPQFFKEILPDLRQGGACYFPVGVLTQAESSKELPFEEYATKFVTTKEATGITVFTSKDLLSINGFDEFYHGWGSEDTDAHVRLENYGKQVVFRNEKVYFLHQWHPKNYRSPESKEPFCKVLEKVNSKYLELTKELHRTRANNNVQWGVMPQMCPTDSIDIILEITNRERDILGVNRQLDQFGNGTLVKIVVTKHPAFKSIKNSIKKIMGKKAFSFYTLDQINDILLFKLTGALRNSPYKYSYSVDQEICLLIKIVG